MELTLYSAPDCHLCERLHGMLDQALFQRGLSEGISIRTCDIHGDPALLARYRDHIPVVAMGDDILLEGRPDAEEVERALDKIVANLPQPETSLVKVYTARDGMEAHFLRGLLEAEGIRAAVQGETLAVGRGDLPMTQETLPSVWVDESDEAAAKAIAADLSRHPAPASASAMPPEPAWRCPKCGEEVEGQFTECWQCGTARPGAG